MGLDVAIPKDYFEWAAKLFDPTRIHEKPEALRGIRVLDLSVIYFGPATADFLGELGARGHCLTGRVILLTRSVTPA